MNVDQVLQTALQAHVGGRIAEAESLYREVLKKRPRDAIALHHLGIIHFQRNEFDAAVELIRKSVAANKSYAEAFNNLGNALRGQGKLEESVAAHRQAIRLKPRYPEGHNNLGSALLAQRKIDEAAAAFRTAISLKPDYAESHFNLGLCLALQEKPDDAVAAYRKAIALRPTLREAHVSLANTLSAQGKIEEAVAALEAAMKAIPNDAAFHTDAASMFLSFQRTDESIVAGRKALELAPGNALAHYNLGVALQRQMRYDEAIAAFRQATVHMPNLAEAHCNLALALVAKGQLDEAIAAYLRAIEIRPNFPEALNNLGAAYRGKYMLEEAADVYRRAAGLKPDYAEAFNNLANILREQGKLTDSIEAYKKALAIEPNNVKTQYQLINMRRHACDWSNYDDDMRRLLQLPGVEPFLLVAAPATPAQQLECARQWTAKVPRGKPFAHDAHKPGQRIRIAYVSADFRRHATAFLMAELFERHDRTRFETFAYSYGRDDGSDVRARLVRAFDHFVDIQATSNAEAARRIYDDSIDILIELKGYTGESRIEIVVDRPAPVQVSFIGYPGTLGADFIDYIFGDRFVTPMEHQPSFSEKIVQLPDCYQPNDTKRQIAQQAPSRRDCGLPEQGFVFCSFNNAYKFNPVFFDIWMRLLKAVPGSVLWLLATNPVVENNLRKEAVARGVSAERVIFCPGIALEYHLARHRNADLFLDTLPCNAHTTASDALWAGLPLLTCAGDTFAGRVAGSLLTAIGMPEMITTSLADYEARALQIATRPELLAALKAKLAHNRATAPLFNIDRMTRGIESAYTTIWERYLRGEAPAGFSVRLPEDNRA